MIGVERTELRRLPLSDTAKKMSSDASGQRQKGPQGPAPSESKDKDTQEGQPGNDVTQFDYVLMGVPDIHGIPRGRVVPKNLVTKFCKEGFGIFQGIENWGFNMEVPKQFPEYSENANGTMMPHAQSTYALPWSSSSSRKLGFTFCSMITPKGERDLASTRHTAERQIERLRQMGLSIMSAFECEFMMFEDEEATRPMGKSRLQYANLDLLDDDVDFLLDAMDVLKGSGIPVELLNNEYEPGQYEITMQPRHGLEAADSVFLLRYGMRAFSRRRGYTATFMPRPRYPQNASGFHLNHSLWNSEGQDVFFDANDPDKLSSFARHWLAGLLHHAPATCALVCPTVNCYQRLHEMLAPGEVFWSMQDRLSLIRVKASDTGAYLEHRVPSSACNPYLALAATIAAGLDGVERKLALPPEGRPARDGATQPTFLPKSLGEALDVLQSDTVLKEALGSKVVDYFTTLKRDFEIKHFENNATADMSRAEVIALERKYYMPFM